MKEVLCIKKPGFFQRDGTRYGPLYNEVCRVTAVQNGFVSEGRLWYPQYTYYKLDGYSDKDSEGFPFFLSRYFVDLISDEELAEAISEEHYISF